jgi:hypothetical protein
MRSVRILRSASLALGLTLLAASGLTAGSPWQLKPAAAATPGAGDACTLLTKPDAEAAVGGTVGEGKATNVNSGGQVAKSCAYDGGGGRHIQLNMFLFAPGSVEIQVYRGLCAKKEQVAGLGDIACWYNEKHRELQMLKGGTVMSIEITRSGDATDALKAVGKKVVDRAPAK